MDCQPTTLRYLPAAKFTIAKAKRAYFVIRLPFDVVSVSVLWDAAGRSGCLTGGFGVAALLPEDTVRAGCEPEGTNEL